MELLHEWQQVAAFVKENGNVEVADKKLFLRIPRTNYSICRNALCGLLGVGKKLWKTSVKRPEDRVHKLKGKMADQSSRGKEMAEVDRSLGEYFEVLKQRGLPFATRVIREETGTTTRDDNVDDVVLPPHISKRSCYIEWCYSRG